MIDNVLLLARFSYKNAHSKPDAYSVWDAYKYGLESHIQNFMAIDYYDLYFENGKKRFEFELENIIQKNLIKYLFVGFAAEDFLFDLHFLIYLKEKYQLCIINTSQDPETFFEPRDRYYNQIADYILPFTVMQNNAIYKNYNLESFTLYSLYNKNMFIDLYLEETIDVSFIGNINKASRMEYIDFLRANGINVQTYGPGSENGFVSHEKMIHLINSSKINLNFTDSSISKEFDFNTNTNFSIGTLINARIQQAKGRLIEIYLTNSFCLSQEGEGTRALFDDDRIVFKNKEELLEKILYYLKHNQDRSIIKKTLHKKALKFDGRNRFKMILSQLAYISKPINQIYIDKAFIINYTSYHFLFFFNFIFKGRFQFLFEELKIFFKYHKFDYKTVYYHFKMQSIYAYKRYRKIQK